MSDQKAEDLKKIEIFANCSNNQIEAIAAVTERVDADEGRTLLPEGHGGHDMYVLTGGSADVHIGGEVIATVGSGDVVGELGLVDGQRSSATVSPEPGSKGGLFPGGGSPRSSMTILRWHDRCWMQ